MPSTLGVNSTTIVKMNNAVMRSASNLGQSGNSWKLRLKYSGRIIVACKRQREADEQQHQPQRRGQITHDADEKVPAAHGRQAVRVDDPRTLEVACAQRRSRTATSTSEGGLSSHEPSRSGDMRTFQPARRMQCGLDEIVRQHVATEWLATGQLRHAARLRESSDADDRVVSPVVAFVAGPRGYAARDQAAVHATGELLNAREQAQ